MIDGVKNFLSKTGNQVSYGTVVSPLMFLSYINDIAINISSSVWLFANDCLLSKCMIELCTHYPYNCMYSAPEQSWLLGLITGKCNLKGPNVSPYAVAIRCQPI